MLFSFQRIRFWCKLVQNHVFVFLQAISLTWEVVVSLVKHNDHDNPHSVLWSLQTTWGLHSHTLFSLFVRLVCFHLLRILRFPRLVISCHIRKNCNPSCCSWDSFSIQKILLWSVISQLFVLRGLPSIPVGGGGTQLCQGYAGVWHKRPCSNQNLR